MRLGTHITGGVLAYTVTATFFQLPWTATGLVLAASAAALPDIDTLGSTVGRTFAPAARRIERRWGHRTITHCYAAQTAVAVLALPLLWLHGGALAHCYAALVAGYVSHCSLDTLTVQGVRVFWPWSDRRGVFPYYNRQETAYRTVTGSRVDAFFGAGFLLLTVPFAVVQIDGYQRLVRKVQADAGAAVRDFLDWSADGYLVHVTVEASDPQHLRRLSGTFEAVGTTGANTLLVRDTTDGRVFSLGPAYSANFQPDRVVAHRGRHVTVSRRRVDLAGRVLADLEALVPITSDANGDVRRARHLLDGQVTLTEPAGVTPDGHRFNTVTGTDRRLALQFATLADLDRLGLSGLIVETGVVTVRVFLRDGEAEDYDAEGLARGEVRRVSFAHKPSEPPRLLVAEGDTVAVGDTLAALTPAAAQNARLDLEDARDDLAAVRSERLPAGTDPVALRARLAQAEAAARRVERRHTEGFASTAAVTAARAGAADLHQQLAQAEGRADEWQRAHAERVRKARARYRRAEHRAAVAERDTYVRSTGAGIVRRIERRAYGPDRTEVRLVLVAPHAEPSHRSEPALSPPAEQRTNGHAPPCQGGVAGKGSRPPTIPACPTADPPGLPPTAPAASGPRSSLPARTDRLAPWLPHPSPSARPPALSPTTRRRTATTTRRPTRAIPRPPKPDGAKGNGRRGLISLPRRPCRTNPQLLSSRSDSHRTWVAVGGSHRLVTPTSGPPRRTGQPDLPMGTPRSFLALASATLLAFTLTACDVADPGPDPGGPEPIAPISPNQQAIVAAAFEEVEALFALGFDDTGRAAARSVDTEGTALAAMRAAVDTTTYTGVYDNTNGKGYLLTLQYRQPQGVGVWTARVQHARAVTYDGNPLDAVETVTLTFLTFADLDAFLGDLAAGTNAYLVGTSSDAEAAFSGFDTWRVAQVFSPGEGLAVVGYTNAQLRESVTVREPVVTLNTNGTGTVRDGGQNGAIRTRYYGADFVVDAEGDVSGTLLRTLLSSGDTVDGAVVSRSDYPDNTFRQTRQRGGDGVVVRENTQG